MVATLEDAMVLVDITELSPHPMNARRGNVDMIAKSLEVLDQYRPVIVNRGTRTGRPNEILAGHHLVKAAISTGRQRIKVAYVDVDDETGKRIMLIDNRSSDVATYDDLLLIELLGSLPDLDATGYDPGDLEELLKNADKIEDPNGDDNEEPTPEDQITLAGVVVGDPPIETKRGQIWKLDRHRLVVADVHTDHQMYAPLLTPDCLFWPYPTLLAPFAEKAKAMPVVMVQPSNYLAGWLLTKWQRVTGQTAELAP